MFLLCWLICERRLSMMSIEMSKMVLRRSLTGVRVELKVKLDWYSSRRVFLGTGTVFWGSTGFGVKIV